MKLREEFVLKALGKVQPFAEVCREFNVSRKTGYKWLERYQELGLAGLVDESRRPDSSPKRIDDELAGAIIALRREFPTWGAKKLRALLLRRKPTATPPSEGTIARLLRENGFVKKQRRRQPSAGFPTRPPKLDPVEPNDVWTVDFKGWWRTRDGLRCEPLTVRDAVSRYLLSVRMLGSTSTEDVTPEFEQIFDKFGLPETIQTDNGAPFASTRGIGGLSQLSAWWVSLGINVVRSRPGCPQDNGGHERMHRDMLALQHASAPTPREQQRLLDEWVTTFNHVRPHEALGMKTPAEVYRPSARRRNHQRLGNFPDDCTLVTLKGRYAHWQGHRIHVGAAFKGYPVGITKIDEERVELWFFHMRLGSYQLGVDGSFEVDVALLGPTPRRRAATNRLASKRRRAATALLTSSAAALAQCLAWTKAALLGDCEPASRSSAAHACPYAGAPSAGDGAAGAATTPRIEPSTAHAVDEPDEDTEAPIRTAGPVDVTSCKRARIPVTSTLVDCHLVTPPPGNGTEVTPVTPEEPEWVTPVTGVGNSGGKQLSPPDGQHPDRAELRLTPPAIPVGWPWISDATRPARRTITTKKEPRDAK